MENIEPKGGITRRDLLKATGTVSAAAYRRQLAGVVLPRQRLCR